MSNTIRTVKEDLTNQFKRNLIVTGAQYLGKYALLFGGVYVGARLISKSELYQSVVKKINISTISDVVEHIGDGVDDYIDDAITTPAERAILATLELGQNYVYHTCDARVLTTFPSFVQWRNEDWVRRVPGVRKEIRNYIESELLHRFDLINQSVVSNESGLHHGFRDWVIAIYNAAEWVAPTITVVDCRTTETPYSGYTPPDNAGGTAEPIEGIRGSAREFT